MGVMTCSRGDCANIMCDRYSHKYGYICYGCFEELVEKGVRTNVALFMKSDVPNRDADSETANNYFDKVFPQQ